MNNRQNSRQFTRDYTGSKDTKKKQNFKPLIFTFLGTFIVFFFAFTVILPIVSPKVDIPAFSDEHSMETTTSDDFKGRLDPRLSDIEAEEDSPTAPKLKMETPKKDAKAQDVQTGLEEPQQEQTYQGYAEPQEPQEPQDITPPSEEDYYNNNIQHYENPAKRQTAPVTPQKNVSRTTKVASTANIPPRPQSVQQYAAPARPVSMAKVVVGSYATPMQARLVSDTLIEMDLNVAPFIKEKNGRYVLQVGSFSDNSKAEGLVQDLRNKGFSAKVVQE
jgi:cell division protein FtsN